MSQIKKLSDGVYCKIIPIRAIGKADFEWTDEGVLLYYAK